MKTNLIRVGILGCGNIFCSHLNAILENPSKFVLVAVCDQSKERVKEIIETIDVKGFTEIKVMLNEMQGKMDLLVISTPNYLHYRQSILALKNGYDVLIEKPVAFTQKEAIEINKIALKIKKKAYAVLQVRYNPLVVELSKILKNKQLGKIRYVEFKLLWQRPITFFKSWHALKKQSGGLMFEIAIHYVDILQLIFGDPKILSVQKFSLKYKRSQVKDTVISTMKFPKNILGHIIFSIAADPKNIECSIEIMGSKGAVKLGGDSLNKLEYFWLSKNGKHIEATKTIKALSKRTSKLEKIGTSPYHHLLYKDLARANGIKVSEAINSIKIINKINNFQRDNEP